MDGPAVEDTVALLDWRRRIAELYAEIRSTRDARSGRRRWSEERARLFREHPQSPVPASERDAYTGPHLYDYEPEWRCAAMLEPAEPRRFELPTSDGSPMAFTRFAHACFTVDAAELNLELYWLEGYGGGLFVPFADSTSGSETYGAGRYVLDTIKGADLGHENGRLVLDFNFAYQPSCSYDPRWSCPLAPPANRLAVPVRAGERSEARPCSELRLTS
jgi:uncharacterized protein (DUF1684 family)